MHRTHGVPIAVHVGDAMLAAALGPLLGNMEVVGLGPSIAILEEIARMARETAEGQMMELRLVHSGQWDLADTTYLRLVHKKTSWYSFVTPLRVAAIIARADASLLRSLFRLGTLLGAAFQIQDDILSLSVGAEQTGKDTLGDLWEGKHTLILAHALRTASPRERQRAIERLTCRRAQPLERCVDELVAEDELSGAGASRLRSIFGQVLGTSARSREDIVALRALIEQQRSLEYARTVAARYCAGASRAMQVLAGQARAGPDLRFLWDLVDFVAQRQA